MFKEERNMKTKRSILEIMLILCLIFSFEALFAGGKEKEAAPAPKEAPKEKVVLKFTDWQGGNEGILKSYKELIKIFEQENPGFTIEYQQYTVTTYNEFLKPALAGGQAPDLFAVYPGPDFFEVVKSGALVNLKPRIDDDWKKWLGPSYNFKGISLEGGIYVVPQDVWTECIWYHKDMLKEIGWKPRDFTESFSVEDYIAMVEPARKKGWDVMLAGFIETWCYFDPFFNFVHQQQPSESPDMVEEAMNGKITWRQEIFRNAIEVFVKLHNAGVWRKDALNMDYQVQAFGKWLEKEAIFMWAQGDWFASAMKPEDNSPANPNIGIVQFPLVNRESVVAFNKNFGTDIGCYSKSKYKDQAIKFLRLTNSPKAAEIFIGNGVNPASGVDPKKIPQTNNPVFNDCIKLYNSPGRFSEVYYYNPDAVKALGDGIGNVLLGVETIDNVLAGLDKICGYPK
jgi:raffinose/stachyose/melibiose transport system substrate-binding protein